jgi:hypothetical protein
LQSARRSHSLCGPCMKHGIPVIADYLDPAFDQIGEQERARYRVAASRL